METVKDQTSESDGLGSSHFMGPSLSDETAPWPQVPGGPVFGLNPSGTVVVPPPPPPPYVPSPDTKSNVCCSPLCCAVGCCTIL